MTRSLFTAAPGAGRQLLWPGGLPSVGPTALPLVPVLVEIPPGSATPMPVSEGTMTPFRDGGGGRGSGSPPSADTCAVAALCGGSPFERDEPHPPSHAAPAITSR